MAAFDPNRNRRVIDFFNFVFPRRKEKGSVIEGLTEHPLDRYNGWTLLQYLNYLALVDASKGSNTIFNQLKGRKSLRDFKKEEIEKLLEEVEGRRFDLEAGLKEAAQTNGRSLERASEEVREMEEASASEKTGEKTEGAEKGETAKKEVSHPVEPILTHPEPSSRTETLGRVGEALARGAEERLRPTAANILSRAQIWIRKHVRFPMILGGAISSGALVILTHQAQFLPIVGAFGVGMYLGNEIYNGLSNQGGGGGAVLTPEQEALGQYPIGRVGTNPNTPPNEVPNPYEVPHQITNQAQGPQATTPSRQRTAPIPPLFGSPFSTLAQIGRRSTLRYVIIGIIIFLLLFLLIGGGALPKQPTTTGGGAIAQCTFYGVSNTVKIGNPDMAAFITDTANKAGIPPSVLAGILALERGEGLASTDPNFFNNDYDATPGYTNVAFGFAQFEPDTFGGVFLRHKQDLSQLYGKTSVGTSPNTPQVKPPPNDSTMRITSIKDSIIMAAFKIKDDKVSAVGANGAWDTTAVQAVGNSYLGDCSNSNYCTNLVKSFQGCSAGSGVHPAPPPTNLPLEQAIQQEFGITFKGFDDLHLQWAREKLWDVSNTNWVKYLKGTTIDARPNDYISVTDTCSHIYLGEKYTDPVAFKVLLMHEGGHIIECQPDNISKVSLVQGDLKIEGPVTNYAREACYAGDTTPNEDYAETVAYYLNPGVDQIITCAPKGPPPFANGQFPLHYNTAKDILGGY